MAPSEKPLWGTCSESTSVYSPALPPEFPSHVRGVTTTDLMDTVGPEWNKDADAV